MKPRIQKTYHTKHYKITLVDYQMKDWNDAGTTWESIGYSGICLHLWEVDRQRDANLIVWQPAASVWCQPDRIGWWMLISCVCINTTLNVSMRPLLLVAKCLVQAWSHCNFTWSASQARTCIAHPSSHSPRWWCRINTLYADVLCVCGSRHSQWTGPFNGSNPPQQLTRPSIAACGKTSKQCAFPFKPKVPGADAQRNYPQCWTIESQLQNSNFNVEGWRW